jgi:hypothetical protein
MFPHLVDILQPKAEKLDIFASHLHSFFRLIAIDHIIIRQYLVHIPNSRLYFSVLLNLDVASVCLGQIYEQIGVCQFQVEDL